MDQDLHKKYENVKLTTELQEMYADLVLSDEALRKVLLTITKHAIDKKDSFGMSIQAITDSVTVNRRVLKKDPEHGSSYEFKHANIDRKQAEKTVDKLLSMGLCYYIPITPAKLINITERGRQVAAEITKRRREGVK